MRESLAPGIAHERGFVVPVTKTVPHLYPESSRVRGDAEVLATGFMVGLVEWACIDAIAPHLDDGEMSLGVHVDLSHDAATPPGLEVAVRVRLEEVDGRRLTFAAEADDGRDRLQPGGTSASSSTGPVSRAWRGRPPEAEAGACPGRYSSVAFTVMATLFRIAFEMGHPARRLGGLLEAGLVEARDRAGHREASPSPRRRRPPSVMETTAVTCRRSGGSRQWRARGRRPSRSRRRARRREQLLRARGALRRASVREAHVMGSDDATRWRPDRGCRPR